MAWFFEGPLFILAKRPLIIEQQKVISAPGKKFWKRKLKPKKIKFADWNLSDFQTGIF